MNEDRTQATPSEFQWEQDAHAYLKQWLPDHEPRRAWASFEIRQDGAIGDVDVPQEICLVETSDAREVGRSLPLPDFVG